MRTTPFTKAQQRELDFKAHKIADAIAEYQVSCVEFGEENNQAIESSLLAILGMLHDKGLPLDRIRAVVIRSEKCAEFVRSLKKN